MQRKSERFAETWKGLTQEERQIIGNAEKERIKNSIAIDAEFSEVPDGTDEKGNGQQACGHHGEN